MEVIEVFETPIRRVVRDRSNPFDVFSDEEFKYRFRFRKETVLSLMQLLSADLEHGVPRNNIFPPILQIAATLCFYAKQSIYRKSFRKMEKWMQGSFLLKLDAFTRNVNHAWMFIEIPTKV